MASLERDLRAFYDAEAPVRAARDPGPMRRDLRDRFADRLAAEGRTRVLECGGGTGHDAVGFAARGFEVVCTDLSYEPLVAGRSRGVAVVQASMRALPFGSASFDAAWTMSTFVHLPDGVVDRALAELLRPVGPGGLVGIGTWGGADTEVRSERDTLGPPRLFCRRTDERWRRTLAAHAEIEDFEVHDVDDDGWVYQFAVLRTPG